MLFSEIRGDLAAEKYTPPRARGAVAQQQQPQTPGVVAAAVQRALAKHAPEEAQENLFSRIDVNKDGVIDRRELKAAVREGVVKDASGKEDTFMASIFEGVASLNSHPPFANGVLSASTAAESTPLATLASHSAVTPPAHLHSQSPASVRFDLAKSTFLERNAGQATRIATGVARDMDIVSSLSLGATAMSPGASVPFCARERDLEIRAMERQGRFGSLEASWLIKNCFAAWRTLIHVQSNIVVNREVIGDFSMTTSELDVIKELQIALAEKDELILELEAQSEKLSRDLVACESRLRVELSDLENHHSLRYLELQSQHSSSLKDAEEDSERRFREARREADDERLRLEEDWRLRIREREDEHEQRIRDAHGQRHRLEEELETRLREAEEAQIQLREEHRLHLLRLEREHADKLRDAHGQRTRLEGEFELRLQEVGDEHSRIKDHHNLHVSRLEKDHEKQLRQVQEQMRELEASLRDSAEEAADQRRLLEDEWRGRVREVEDAHSRSHRDHSLRSQQLEEEWSARLREAEDAHARSREEHGLHISRLEREHGIFIRNAEETRIGLETEWGLRLEQSSVERDLQLRQIEEEHAAQVKLTLSRAAMSFVQGMGSSKDRAIKAMVWHGWLRAATVAQIEEEYERRLNNAEELRTRLEERWDSTLQQADADRQQTERQWNVKLREADEEQRQLRRELQETRLLMASKRDKAALMLCPTKLCAATFSGWSREVHRMALQRELEIRVREANEHKKQLQLEHESQLFRLNAERMDLQREHDLQVRQLAEEESRRLRKVELEFNRVQDDLDVRIRQHEDEKVILWKKHDDERERLRKESIALTFMHKDVMGSAANTIINRHQARLVFFEIFVTWSQHCVHERWRRTVDNIHNQHREEFVRSRTRRERSLERSSLRGSARMMMYQAIMAWWAVIAESRWGRSAATRERAMVEELRWRRSEGIMLVATQGQTRLLLVQVLLIWLHTASREILSRRHAGEVSQRAAFAQRTMKAWGHRWALTQWGTRNIVMLQKLLSSWWLWAREAAWGYHLSVHSGAAARYRSREDVLLARSILRMDRDNVTRLVAVIFGVLKSRIADSKSLQYYRARREQLLDRWGMQYGLTKGIVFCHRLFSGWLRAARCEHNTRLVDKRARSHFVHIAERLQRAMLGPNFAFYTWLGNTKHGRSRREADALGREIVLIRLKHGKSWDRCSGVFTNLHFKAFMHTIFTEWCQQSHTMIWGRLADENARAAGYHRERRKVTNLRFAVKCWDTGVRCQSRLSLQAWRHVVLESQGLVTQQRLREIRRSLRQEMEDNDLFRTTFMIQGLFTRWKHWTVAMRHQTAVEVLRRAALEQGISARPGRVHAVVCAIEEQRARLSKWEAFMRWSYIVRVERQERLIAPQASQVYVRAAPQVMTTYLPPTVTRTVAPPVYLPATTVSSSVSPRRGWHADSARARVLQPTNFEGWRATASNSPAESEFVQPSITTYSPRTVRSVVVPTASAPLATVGIDVTHDGRADLLVTGADLNHNGIPDALEAKGSEALVGSDSRDLSRTRRARTPLQVKPEPLALGTSTAGVADTSFSQMSVSPTSGTPGRLAAAALSGARSQAISTAEVRDPQLFDMIDTNHDNMIDRQELSQAIQSGVLEQAAPCARTGRAPRWNIEAAGDYAHSCYAHPGSMRVSQPLSLTNSVRSISRARSVSPAPSQMQVCACGNPFVSDAAYCRKCGARRPTAPVIEAGTTPASPVNATAMGQAVGTHFAWAA